MAAHAVKQIQLELYSSFQLSIYPSEIVHACVRNHKSIAISANFLLFFFSCIWASFMMFMRCVDSLDAIAHAKCSYSLLFSAKLSLCQWNENHSMHILTIGLDSFSRSFSVLPSQQVKTHLIFGPNKRALQEICYCKLDSLRRAERKREKKKHFRYLWKCTIKMNNAIEFMTEFVVRITGKLENEQRRQTKSPRTHIYQPHRFKMIVHLLRFY